MYAPDRADPTAQNRVMMGPDGTVHVVPAQVGEIHRHQQKWKTGPPLKSRQDIKPHRCAVAARPGSARHPASARRRGVLQLLGPDAADGP